MKLLFDQNISFRVIRLLPDSFADSRHVSSVGLNDCHDSKIWRFAKENGFTVVTFDADFFDIVSLKGFPPKIIWLRTGNPTFAEIADCFISNYSNINSFIEHPELNCLKIYQPSLLVALRASL